MIKRLWSIARLDLILWRRTPFAIAAAVIPPIGMAMVLVTLSLAVLQQPVALVVDGKGPNAQKMQRIIQTDSDAYFLTITDAKIAQRMLDTQEVAAVITIPSDFDEKVAKGEAEVGYVLNNVDIDFSDDIRRSVDRSVAQFDAPQLKLDAEEEEEGPAGSVNPEADNQYLPNPYRVDVYKRDLRQTNVEWFSYQTVSAFILLILNVGLMGTALLSAQDIERKTSLYLVVSPTPSWQLMAGRILGGLIAVMIALLPALILAAYFKVISPPLTHWPALAAIFTTTALAASGLGALLGALFKGSRLIAMAASVVSTYLFLLGGGFTTIAFVPQWVRNLSAFVPTRYAIDGMRQALFYNNLDGVVLDLIILSSTAILTIALGSFAVRKSQLV
ncbi:hypothetical protein A2774_01080 [Candidatus Roizmanbacteria bacterium RIFCSPHIGHO2_01_FULL_39_12c]|uniref:ABC-2 type transporter transmembrane domain-containing protein n=1 Tax=Candidatus Roizmanbacteria bacterium RIFCSPHIGHO2_01_FULL_39_12c TaxID=1802031 RepID=A0A1F7G7W3_9BACT|nr:MAG: hypothetical protein A2774_01080 [Candidatus Roizmanbacteria bacterium RIFCSPHIGHO2_01_FULL_39_12c]OGK46423.1 MAG: hypothetical protein A2963_01490 [Candidatus Roizmanbacteria bacterium RIFCSPLOWO2_01_FULL_40_13]